jgi:hypothetical protein
VSDFSRPGGSTGGTAVDPIGPGGVLIDPSEITQPGVWAPGPAPAGYHMVTDGVGGWLIVPDSAAFRAVEFQMHHSSGVPGAAGVRFLRFGDGVICSTVGFRLGAAAGTLKGLSIQVENASANAYDLQLLSDPAARVGVPTPIVGASLTLAAGQVFARDRSLSVAIADLELGAWVIRTAGAGAGLGQIAVVLEFELSAP